MLITTEGIVLQKINYSDSSQIIKIYTQSYGITSLLLKGIRSKSKKNKLNLHPLALIEVVVNKKENSTIQIARETKLIKPLNTIQSDVLKSTIVIFLAEFLLKVLKQEEHDYSLYSFIKNNILLLEETDKNPSNFHLVFIAKLTKFLGFEPQGTYTNGELFSLKEGTFAFHKTHFPHEITTADYAVNIARLLNSEISDFYTLSFSNNERANLLSVLVEYFKIQTDNSFKLKSIAILNEVLS